jgi:hypothetical protein
MPTMTDIDYNRVNAEIAKLINEAIKLASEDRKLRAEESKLNAETRKLGRDHTLYPYAIGAAMATAVGTITAAAIKYL